MKKRLEWKKKHMGRKANQKTVTVIQLKDQSSLESYSGSGYKDKEKMGSINIYAHKTLSKEMESRMTPRFLV